MEPHHLPQEWVAQHAEVVAAHQGDSVVEVEETSGVVTAEEVVSGAAAVIVEVVARGCSTATDHQEAQVVAPMVLVSETVDVEWIVVVVLQLSVEEFLALVDPQNDQDTTLQLPSRLMVTLPSHRVKATDLVTDTDKQRQLLWVATELPLVPTDHLRVATNSLTKDMRAILPLPTTHNQR